MFCSMISPDHHRAVLITSRQVCNDEVITLVFSLSFPLDFISAIILLKALNAFFILQSFIEYSLSQRQYLGKRDQKRARRGRKLELEEFFRRSEDNNFKFPRREDLVSLGRRKGLNLYNFNLDLGRRLKNSPFVYILVSLSL